MREESKLRESDEKIESLNNLYLTENFYKDIVEKYIKNTDKKLQMAGIDSIFIMDGKQFNCDEKVAAHYVNRPLTTFAFELSFIDRGGNVKEGWFLDKSKLSNSYLLCWLDKADIDKPTSIEQIRIGEIVLITKNSLLSYLSSIGWSLDLLSLKTHAIRNNNDRKFGNIIENRAKFSYSEQLVEKPINVIISREVLRKWSYYNDTIKK